MPDQPADPIHYDMKIPPEPKQRDEQSEEAKKHGDKIDVDKGPADPSTNSSDESPNGQSDSA